jgi:hypothetical protein
MTSTLLTLSIALLLPGAGPTQEARKPNPFAPSLPTLTDQEEEQLDQIIGRFIQFDTGNLPGKAGQKALADFTGLGAESTFALVRGVNIAANMEASCPAATIGKKLLSIIRSSQDADLMDFLQENIGAGLKGSPHAGILKDLKAEAMMRKRAILLARRKAPPEMIAMKPIPNPEDTDRFIVVKPRTDGEKKTGSLSMAELNRQLDGAKGDRLKELLAELEPRPTSEVLAALSKAAAEDSPSDVRYVARDILLKNLTRQPGASLKDYLKDDRSEVRLAAAKVTGERRLRHGDELIVLLDDKNNEVRQAAHDALALLAGTDFGPDRTATVAERTEAVRQWRSWWAKQTGK